PDSCKYVALGNTAGIALIDGRTQCGKLSLVLLLLTLQSPQGSAHDLASIFVASTLNFLYYEPVKLFGQINIASRHKHSTFVSVSFRSYHYWQRLLIGRTDSLPSLYCR